MARPRPGQRRIDKPRLRALLGEDRLNTLAKEIAARDGKTPQGARRQLQRWRDVGEGNQEFISDENADRLSLLLGVTPDAWSVSSEVDLLEAQLERQLRLEAEARAKADEIREQLRVVTRRLRPRDG